MDLPPHHIKTGQLNSNNWAVKEPKLSYHNPEAMLLKGCPYYGSSN